MRPTSNLVTYWVSLKSVILYINGAIEEYKIAFYSKMEVVMVLWNGSPFSTKYSWEIMQYLQPTTLLAMRINKVKRARNYTWVCSY
jgi:hypothetical protein